MRSIFVAIALFGSIVTEMNLRADDASRAAARNRPRRILFNNDGGESAVEMKTATRQAFLDARTTPLAGTHVDSIFYCTRSSGFGVFTHFTKVGQVFTCTEGRYAGNQTGALRKAGLDPLTMQVEFGKKHNIEVFWSMRMNDTHDGAKADYGPIMFRDNKLKNAHPEYLMSTSSKPPKHGTWTAVNYARPEIRDLAFRYIEEVCRNYDVTGVELDFFRHPVFFKSTSRGDIATAEECQCMTDLIGRVRTMMDDVGKSRGRPLLLAVKLPDSVAYCKAIGLDLETWLANGWIDLLIPGGYFQLNEWEVSVALARKYRVKVYPSLDESRLKDATANKARVSEPGYRGRAAAAWAAGGDGIYLFNFFANDSPLFKQLGDRATLARLDRDYFGSPRGVSQAAGGNLPYAKYQTIETLNPGNPKSLAAWKPVSATISIGETDETLRGRTVTLKVNLGKLDQAPAATWNDKPITLTKREDGGWEAPLAAEDVKTGLNRTTLTASAGTPRSAQWLDLMVTVREKK